MPGANPPGNVRRVSSPRTLQAAPSAPSAERAPAAERPRRRNRTVQRERLLEMLRSTDTHPTAANLFEGLRGEFPRLSRGTVYRNLEVLVCEGVVEQVPSRSGVMRYDGNPRPHHHFVCDACGDIRDLDIQLPQALATRLQRRYKLRADRVRADFFGLCEACRGRDS